MAGDSWGDFEPAPQEIASEDQSMRRRQRQFRMAAEAVAEAMGLLPEVEKVALFGSVARPLEKEVPRFRRFRRARIEISHECKDVDLEQLAKRLSHRNRCLPLKQGQILRFHTSSWSKNALAVWVSGLGRLKGLQKARSRALNDLMAERNIGVAHHQVDVFLLEPGTDRYLGRLCRFGQCPKGKDECRVPGCGATPLLRQHERFRFDWAGSSQGHVVLYEKDGGK